MTLLVYAVTRAPELMPSDLPDGVAGRPIELICAGDLAAAVGQVELPEGPPDAAIARQFNGVVQWLHQRQTTVPMRFGCVRSSHEEVARMLRDHRAPLEQALRRLDGCVEMSLRAMPPAEAEPAGQAEPARTTADATADVAAGRGGDGRAAGASGGVAIAGSESAGRGRDYLAACRERYRRKDARGLWLGRIAEQLRRPFASFARESSSEITAGGPPLVSLYFLIARADERPFRQAFENLRAATDMPLLLSGPWPPYTFARLDPPAAGGLDRPPFRAQVR